MINEITSENEYNDALAVIEIYLQKGSKGMTFEDKQELLRLSIMVEAYEQIVCPMPMSK